MPKTVEDHGTYTKDGRTRTARSPGEAVTLQHEGWVLEKSDPSSNAGDGVPEPPPAAGRGSGTDEWRAYATEVLGLEVAEDATRDQIMEQVEAAPRPDTDSAGK